MRDEGNIGEDAARQLYAFWREHPAGVDVGAISHLGHYLVMDVGPLRWHSETEYLLHRARAVLAICEPDEVPEARERRASHIAIQAQFLAVDELELKAAKEKASAKVIDLAQAREKREANCEAPVVEKLSEVLLRVSDQISAPLPAISTPFPHLNWLLLGGFRAGELVYLGARPGQGKALALDTALPTPTGWTTMEEVSEGDYLIGADGHPTRVLAVSPILHKRKCYAVCFSDGTEIVADAEHQWLTSTRASRKSWERLHVANRQSPFSRDQRHKAIRPAVVTTEEIATSVRVNQDQRANHSVHSCAAFQLPVAVLPVDPYLLGVWLGDGCSASARFTSADEEIIRLIIETGQRVTRHSTRYEYGLPGGLQVELRTLGVLNNKHIPPRYLRASEKQRRALLAGLLDTDGTVNEGGGPQFTTTSPLLAEGVLELLRTLGYRVSCTRKRVKGRTEASSVAFNLNFSTVDPVFRLARKAVRHRQWRASRSTRRSEELYIVEVRSVPSVPVRCVRVEAKDNLYLASKSCIPTHNSALALDILRHAAYHGHTTLMVTREMSNDALGRRLIAQDGRLDAGSLRTGKGVDVRGVHDTIERLYDLPVHMTQKARTIAEIHAVAQAVPELALVIVDYLQLLTAPREIRDRRLQVEYLSVKLKAMAVHMAIPILVLSSLSRPETRAAQQPPTLASLRESGSLEHDADTVILLHRVDGSTQTQCIVAKNRDAMLGTVDLVFCPESVAFDELMSADEEQRYGG